MNVLVVCMYTYVCKGELGVCINVIVMLKPPGEVKIWVGWNLN